MGIRTDSYWSSYTLVLTLASEPIVNVLTLVGCVFLNMRLSSVKPREVHIGRVGLVLAITQGVISHVEH